MGNRNCNTPQTHLVKSEHFAWRQARRGIKDTEIALALLRGKRFHEHGEIVYFLGRRQIPAAVPANIARRAEGTVVVVTRSGVGKTTYRNPAYCRTLRKRRRHLLPRGKHALSHFADADAW